MFFLPTGLIRSKALIQYCTPYVAVDLKTMAAAFNTNEKSITEEVSQLIIQNKISARIDTFKNVLYRKEADAKNATFTNALILGQSVFQEVWCSHSSNHTDNMKMDFPSFFLPVCFNIEPNTTLLNSESLNKNHKLNHLDGSLQVESTLLRMQMVRNGLSVSAPPKR